MDISEKIFQFEKTFKVKNFKVKIWNLDGKKIFQFKKP